MEDQILSLVAGMPRAEVRLLLDELDGLLGTPPCGEAQADGVPCPTAIASCDECGRARAVLAAVRRRMGLD